MYSVSTFQVYNTGCSVDREYPNRAWSTKESYIKGQEGQEGTVCRGGICTHRKRGLWRSVERSSKSFAEDWFEPVREEFVVGRHLLEEIWKEVFQAEENDIRWNFGSTKNIRNDKYMGNVK